MSPWIRWHRTGIQTDSLGRLARSPMSLDRSPTQKWADVLLIAFFAAAIGLPLLRWLTMADTDGSDENRLLAPLPQLQRKAAILKQFPAQFEAYFNDHFGFRPLLI